MMLSKRTPETAAAWIFWLKHWAGFSPSTWPVVEGVTEEQAEQYLVIVNTAARNNCLPNAIPDEYKLADIWADPAEMRRQPVTIGNLCGRCRSVPQSQRHADMCL